MINMIEIIKMIKMIKSIKIIKMILDIQAHQNVVGKKMSERDKKGRDNQREWIIE